MLKKSYIVIARIDFCDKAMTGSSVFQHPIRLRKNPQKDFSGTLSDK